LLFISAIDLFGGYTFNIAPESKDDGRHYLNHNKVHRRGALRRWPGVRAGSVGAPCEHLGATSENVGNGAAMQRRHRRAMRLEIVLREPAKDVGNFDHGV
jgi:hypothetical protein